MFCHLSDRSEHTSMRERSRVSLLSVLLGAPLLLFTVGLGSAAAVSISEGGLTDLGTQKILVTQGLSGANLVAGKQTLFRLYPPTGVDMSRVRRATYHIRSAAGTSRTLTLSGSQLIMDPVTGGGASVGLPIPGTMFPISGSYTIDFVVSGAGGAPELFRVAPLTLSFLAAKDLRLHVVLLTHEGFFNADPSWYLDVENSLRRLGSMLPVRDGVSRLNADTENGIRFTMSECDGWAAGFNDCAFGRTRAINAGAGDDVDVTVVYRPGFYDTDPPGDPSPGGNSGRPAAPNGDLRRAACVSGVWQGIPMTAACFGQEIGHNFGLEPPSSPHAPDPGDPGHSKDAKINDPFAFDFINRIPYTDTAVRFLGDVMNNSRGGAFQGGDSVSYNAFDWNWLQGQFAGLSSTGSEANPRSTLCTPDFPCVGKCSGREVNRCGETVICSEACPGGKVCKAGICTNPPCPLDPPICCLKPWLPACDPRSDIH